MKLEDKMATFFKTDGTAHTIHPANGSKFTLEELQKFVGGYIEKIPLSDFGSPAFCNEDGRLLKLPVNTVASKMYFTQILGDVIVCERGEVD
jgi:hypothetical protein